MEDRVPYPRPMAPKSFFRWRRNGGPKYGGEGVGGSWPCMGAVIPGAGGRRIKPRARPPPRHSLASCPGKRSVYR